MPYTLVESIGSILFSMDSTLLNPEIRKGKNILRFKENLYMEYKAVKG
jgi:hypothetical protein